MKITHYGHSCLLVEDAAARILLDPGVFSTGYENLEGLTAILVTHQHPDHLDRAKLPALLERNPDARLHTDPDTQFDGATPVRAGDVLDLGTEVRAFGRDHAVIHPDIPMIANTGYLIGNRFFHPGDSFTIPEADVEILGLPTAAPWQKLSEAVDYLRAVAPRVAIPIHEKVVAFPDMYYGRFRDLSTSAVTVLEDGTSLER
jgi:L-ascorbate metabolism protein UlaG (beta-lactamase superfamily)